MPKLTDALDKKLNIGIEVTIDDLLQPLRRQSNETIVECLFELLAAMDCNDTLEYLLAYLGECGKQLDNPTHLNFVDYLDENC